MQKTIEQSMAKHHPKMPTQTRVRKAKRTVLGIFFCLLAAVLVFGGVLVVLLGQEIATIPIIVGFCAGLYGSHLISGDAASAASKSTTETVASLATTILGVFFKRGK